MFKLAAFHETTKNYPRDNRRLILFIHIYPRSKLVERMKCFTIIGTDVRVRISEYIDLLLMYQIRYYFKTIEMSE